MKKAFKEVLDIDGVEGVMLLDKAGKVLYSSFKTSSTDGLQKIEGPALIKRFADIQEAEFVYENRRIYIRRANQNLILVVMSGYTQVAMIRINCNVLIPALSEKADKPKGLSRFFRKR